MKRLFLFSFLLLSTVVGFSQRKVTEATLRYSISLAGDADSSLRAFYKSAQYICYLKGVNSRMDLITNLGKQTTLLQGKTNTAIIWREFGSQRYLTTLTTSQWAALNQRYEDSKLSLTADSVKLLGYQSRKAFITLQDSTRSEVWFTTELIPVYRDFQLVAKTLPGLLVQYEAAIGNNRVIYQLEEINFNPVPQALFDVPKTGYRLLSFEESKWLGKNQ